MVFSIALCLLSTAGLFLLLRKRLRLKIAPVFIGALSFFVFALVLEQLLHSFVLQRGETGDIALLYRPWLFVLYSIFAAGLFEETARFAVFKLLKAKYTGVSTAISYGIGHGGLEVALTCLLAMAANLVLSLMANTGRGIGLPEAQAAAVMAALAETKPWMFAISGIERVSAMGIHISMSVLVWHAANTKGTAWLYPLAICLHALGNLAAGLYQAGLLGNLFIVEIATGIASGFYVFLAIKIHGRLQ